MKYKNLALAVATVFAVSAGVTTTFANTATSVNIPPSSTAKPVTTPATTGTTATAGTGTTATSGATSASKPETSQTTTPNTDSNAHENCEVKEAIDANYERLLEEQVLLATGTQKSIENAQSQNASSQGCLAGFVETLDFTQLIPTGISPEGAGLKQMIMTGIEQAVKAKKAKIEKQVCTMAQSAFQGVMDNFQQTRESMNVANRLENAIAGYAGEQLDKLDQKTNKILDKHMNRLQSEIDEANSKLARSQTADPESSLGKFAQQIDEYAQKGAEMARQQAEAETQRLIQQQQGQTATNNKGTASGTDTSNTNTGAGNTNSGNNTKVNIPPTGTTKPSTTTPPTGTSTNTTTTTGNGKVTTPPPPPPTGTSVKPTTLPPVIGGG